MVRAVAKATRAQRGSLGNLLWARLVREVSWEGLGDRERPPGGETE